MLLTMLCLTLVVFFLINLEPNLKKLAISQTEMRATAEQLESWLQRNGYRQNFFVRYGQWLGVLPKQPNHRSGDRARQCRASGSARSPRCRPFRACCRAISAARPSSRTKVAEQAVPGAAARPAS